MIYVASYLSIGGLVMLWAFTRGYEQREFEPLPFRDSLLDSLVEDVVFPLIAYSLVVVLWPLAILAVVHERLFRKANEPKPRPEFAVGSDDLRQKLSIGEVELSERVEDPLGAVPELPFGHLNAAWSAFVGQLVPGAELWSFASEWKGGWSGEVLQGYVEVTDGKPDRYFLTLRKRQRVDEPGFGRDLSSPGRSRHAQGGSD